MENMNDQEEFWANEFGEEYRKRNASKEMLSANLHLFSEILKSVSDVSSYLEFGCNIGMNLQALGLLDPNADINGVEINKKSAMIANELECVSKVFNCSIDDFSTDRKFDFVFTKGVLIHIHPENLERTYTQLAKYTEKYLLISEYFDPNPVSLSYRGHEDKLFKRDFCADFLNYHQNFKLVDYGFKYKAVDKFPHDNITWFLLKKGTEV